MLVKLRIVFTVLSALCAAAVVPVGTFFGFIGAMICIVAALMFFVIMLGFKNKQEALENPPEEKVDFLHPKKTEPTPEETTKNKADDEDAAKN